MPVPVASRSEGNLYSGEKRAELHVVPKFAVSATPEIADRAGAAGGARATRDVRVTVRQSLEGRGDGGRRAADAAGLARDAGHAAGDVLARGRSRHRALHAERRRPQPPLAAKPGDVALTVRASAARAASRYAQGYQVVEYPHTTRRHVLRAPEVMVERARREGEAEPDRRLRDGRGRRSAAGARAARRARWSCSTRTQLAWGDLNRFDVVMTGVRAYERRADLRAYNQRLLDYARAGGTVIVNYNKFEFNEAQYGPYPGKVEQPPRDRRELAGARAACRSIRCSPRPTGSPTPTGRAGARSAASISSTDGRDPQIHRPARVRRSRSPTTRAPKRGALVEAKVGHGPLDLPRASGCGGSCRPAPTARTG